MNNKGIGEIVIYQPDESFRLEVKVDADSVWLNRQQIATLFDRDVKTIGKHINNALKEELGTSPQIKDNLVVANNATTKNSIVPVVAKYATTAADGKTYQVEYYNLDVIISVGYRVKSRNGILFRQWANNVLRDHLLRGYSVNKHLVALQQHIDDRFLNIETELVEHKQQIEVLMDKQFEKNELIFNTGCVFDAWRFLSDLVRSANVEIILVDNFCDDRVLDLLSKRKDRVNAVVHTRYSKSFIEDLAKHNEQYASIEYVQIPQKNHDRWLIVDGVVYLLGTSVKDMGNALTAVVKTCFTKDTIIEGLK